MRGHSGEKRPGDVIGNAVHCCRVLVGRGRPWTPPREASQRERVVQRRIRPVEISKAALVG